MKWALWMSLLMSLGQVAMAAPGDAAVCQASAWRRQSVCRSHCKVGSSSCRLRCYRSLVSAKKSCPGAASSVETRVMELTNAERAAAGLSPLTWDLRLGASAQAHAANMAAQDRSEHNLDSKTPADRMTAEKYAPFTWVAENIYWGQGSGKTTAEAAVDWWMNSTGHRANILDSRTVNIGIGVRPGANGKMHFCQNFGKHQ